MRSRPVIEWIGLGLPTLASAAFGLIVAGEALDPHGGGQGSWIEGAAVVVGASVLVGATLYSWRAPRRGGAALVGAAALLAAVIAFTAGRHVLVVALLLPAPWFVGGLLLLVSRSRARGSPRPPRAPTSGSGPSGGSRRSAP